MDWFMQRGQTPMFAREIIYTPYFYLQKRNHVDVVKLDEVLGHFYMQNWVLQFDEALYC
jgi:hypothetical protein